MPEDADGIELRGLRLTALVGALAEEAERAQPIEVDLDVAVDLGPSGRSDDLADTVDYGALCDVVVGVAGAGHVRLLEHLAERMAVAVLAADRRIEAVTLSVRKLRPPVPHQLATAGVRITRVR